MNLRSRIACGALLVGCASKDSGGTEATETGTAEALGEAVLLTHDGWAYVPPEADPFEAQAPGTEPCPSVAYGAENGFFELETDYCAIATFSQELAADVPKGADIRFVVWNLDLWAPDPTEAVRVLRLGEHDLWTTTVPVPGNEDVSEVVVPAPEDLPAGTPAWFHLRNHGINSWRIGDVERVSTED